MVQPDDGGDRICCSLSLRVEGRWVGIRAGARRNDGCCCSSASLESVEEMSSDSVVLELWLEREEDSERLRLPASEGETGCSTAPGYVSPSDAGEVGRDGEPGCCWRTFGLGRGRVKDDRRERVRSLTPGADEAEEV